MTDAPCNNFICIDDIPASGDCIEDLTIDQIESAIEEASYLLYRMSGRRVYGMCEDTVRPNPRTHICSAVCDCYSTVQLGERPERILWVRVDGEMLDPTAYKLDRMNWKLWRIDGDYWPTTQDLTKPLDQMDTFGIRYRHGHPIDPATKRAALDLTLELCKLLVPGQRPKLPGNVTSLSRRGVSLTMKDKGEIIKKGGSYIESVNHFLSIHNPDNEPESFVYSPDTSPTLINFGRNG